MKHLKKFNENVDDTSNDIEGSKNPPYWNKPNEIKNTDKDFFYWKTQQEEREKKEKIRRETPPTQELQDELNAILDNGTDFEATTAQIRAFKDEHPEIRNTDWYFDDYLNRWRDKFQDEIEAAKK